MNSPPGNTLTSMPCSIPQPLLFAQLLTLFAAVACTAQLPVDLKLVNPSDAARDGEIVTINAEDLAVDGMAADELAARAADGSGDVTFQIDDLDGNGSFAGPDQLLLRLDFAPGQTHHVKLVENGPAGQARTCADVTEDDGALIVKVGHIQARIAEILRDVKWRGATAINDAYWYLTGGGAFRNRSAEVKRHNVVANGPIRCRVRLVTGCDYGPDPDGIKFLGDYDFFADTGNIRVTTHINWNMDPRPVNPNLIVDQSPGGSLEYDADSYAIERSEGDLAINPLKDIQRQYKHAVIEPWSCVFDPETKEASVGLFVDDSEFSGKFSFLGPIGRTYARYARCLIASDAPRTFRYRLHLYDGGPQKMAAVAERWQSPIQVSCDGRQLPPPPAYAGQTRPRELPQIDPDQFLLALRTEPADAAISIASGDTTLDTEAATDNCPFITAPLGRDAMGRHGAVDLTFSGDTAKLKSWGAYLLPGWEREAIAGKSSEWLRRYALAFETGTGELPAQLDLDRHPHATVRLGDRGRLTSLQSAELELLDSDKAESGFCFGDGLRPAAGNVQEIDDGVRLTYPQPKADENALEVTMTRPQEDRLRFNCRYEVKKAVDRPLPVHFVLRPNGRMTRMPTFTWRRGGRDPARAQPLPGPESRGERYAFMSQTPFALVRFENGAWIGALDYDQTNIIMAAGRDDSGRQLLRVSTYLWPRNQGRVYNWSFELIAGWCDSHNALLQAIYPHTEDYTEQFHGAMVGAGRAGDAGDAYKDGARMVWHHGWFHRNGKYFNPQWPFDKPYQTVWGKRKFSYAKLKSNIDAFRDADIDCLAYFQFAGVSENVTDEFEPSIIRTPGGEQIVAGRDGDYRNIWANPDPDGVYGKSLLKQVDQLLEATDAPGIALDRADRLDFTYGWDQYDYGNFNGYASVFKHDGRRRPVASITIAGRQWYTELRRILDRHNATVVPNVPVTPRVFRLSDGGCVDQPLTPNSMFYLKALSNGKSMFLIDTHRPGTPDDEPLQARLTQTLPRMGGRAEWTYDGDCGRLLYVVSHNGHYPTLWLFDNGHSRMSFDPTRKAVREMYADSEFVPRTQ